MHFRLLHSGHYSRLSTPFDHFGLCSGLVLFKSTAAEVNIANKQSEELWKRQLVSARGFAVQRTAYSNQVSCYHASPNFYNF